MEVVIPWVILLPLLGAGVLMLTGRRWGNAAGVLASATVGVSFVLGLQSFFDLLSRSEEARRVTVRIGEWISVGRIQADIAFNVDQLALVMVLVVTGVSFLIHIYSISYMAGDPRYPLYFGYLNLFVAAMLLLVLADNILLMFVGWEGVGLCSYLLIGFWFEQPVPANAAKKAFIVNRIGDFFFLLGIFVLVEAAETLSLQGINEAAGSGAVGAGLATIGALLLFGGATGKSAQIPLYVWLPDAMAGPTPVSALIHAATMVTAGVYLIARLGPLFAASGGTALAVAGWVGAVTALLAALFAIFENDIKRVLAYSTISQIGYMFLALGVGAYAVAIFHLVTHAFFKALLSLGAGSVMHALEGTTNVRTMGGLRKAMPVTGWSFLSGVLAISGIIPFSGFFSKDAILASAWAEGSYGLWALGLVTALITAFYMARVYFRVFEGELVTPQGTHPHEAPPSMAFALITLGVLALIGGVINLPGVETLVHFLSPVTGAGEAPEGLSLYLLAGGALLVAVAGLGAGAFFYLNPRGVEVRARLSEAMRPVVAAFEQKLYVDELYGRLIVLPLKSLAAFAAYVFDLRFVDGIATGLAGIVGWSGEAFRRVQSGYVRNYALVPLLGAVAMFSALLIRSGL